MTRTNNTVKNIATFAAAVTAWTLFAVFTINASSGPMIDAVKAMS